MTDWASQTLDTLVSVINDPVMAAGLVAFLVLLVAIFYLTTLRFWKTWTETKDWWPAAKSRQKQMMLNFLYKEEQCPDAAVLESWACVIVVCTHHFFAGMLILPVLFLGWTGAGSLGQLFFYVGILLELGFDVFDWVRATVLTWCPKCFPCMAEVSVGFWLIAVVCHHTLGCLMILPMLLYYPSRPEFHRIAAALLLAAGFAYLTGAYKFTLNTSEAVGWRRYKAVVVFQFVVIYYTRLWLWFFEAASLLQHFNDTGDSTFFWGALACCILMTGFNLILVIDCTKAAVKWLPRQMPTEEEEMAELEESKSATSFASSRWRKSFASGQNAAMKEDLVVQMA